MTFNVINAGDPGNAAPIMQNFRHVNYGNALLPVNSTGVAVDSTIDLGSSSYYFNDGYIDDLYISNDINVTNDINVSNYLVVNSTVLHSNGSTGRTGFGTDGPDTIVHIYDGTAGSVSPLSGTNLTLESNASNYISFLNTNSSDAGIIFGDVDDNDVASILYLHGTNTMYFTLNGSQAIEIDSRGSINLSSYDITGCTSLVVDNITINEDTILCSNDLVFNTSSTKYEFTNDSTTEKVVMMQNAGNAISPTITLDSSGGGFFMLGEKSGTNQTITLCDIYRSTQGYGGCGVTLFITIKESSGNYEYRQISFLIERSGDGGDEGSITNTLLSSLGSVTAGTFSLNKSSTTVMQLQYTISAGVSHNVTGYGIVVH